MMMRERSFGIMVVETRFTCPHCGNQIPSPGWMGYAWCGNCVDYVPTVQHVITYDPTGPVEHMRY
jgi:transcription elongation factor Elf1